MCENCWITEQQNYRNLKEAIQSLIKLYKPLLYYWNLVYCKIWQWLRTWMSCFSVGSRDILVSWVSIPCNQLEGDTLDSAAAVSGNKSPWKSLYDCTDKCILYLRYYNTLDSIFSTFKNQNQMLQKSKSFRWNLIEKAKLLKLQTFHYTDWPTGYTPPELFNG